MSRWSRVVRYRPPRPFAARIHRARDYRRVRRRDANALVLSTLFASSSFLFGPWGEELGWRGYAQPQLQRGIGALGASLVVGTIWSVWHYWPVLTPAGGHLSELFSTGFATWWAYELANSVMMAWLYNRTGGSLPIAWAAHAGLSLGQTLVDKHPIPFGSFVVTFWVAAALVVIWNGPRNLSRREMKPLQGNPV